nr:uncharacterized protein LOC123849274 [Mirounga angustirostris]
MVESVPREGSESHLATAQLRAGLEKARVDARGGASRPCVARLDHPEGVEGEERGLWTPRPRERAWERQYSAHKAAPRQAEGLALSEEWGAGLAGAEPETSVRTPARFLQVATCGHARDLRTRHGGVRPQGRPALPAERDQKPPCTPRPQSLTHASGAHGRIQGPEPLVMPERERERVSESGESAGLGHARTQDSSPGPRLARMRSRWRTAARLTRIRTRASDAESVRAPDICVDAAPLRGGG